MFTARYGLVCAAVCLLRGTDWFVQQCVYCEVGLVCAAVRLLRGTERFVQQCVYCAVRTGLYSSVFTASYGLVCTSVRLLRGTDWFFIYDSG